MAGGAMNDGCAIDGPPVGEISHGTVSDENDGLGWSCCFALHGPNMTGAPGSGQMSFMSAAKPYLGLPDISFMQLPSRPPRLPF
jgi:hypothetical protein